MIIKCINPHSVSLEDAFNCLETSEAGLSQTEVTKRINAYGRNNLPLAPPKPAWRRFLSQFHNVLIYVLIGSGTLSALLHHYVDSGVILAVVLVNAVVGFIQEGKAEDALRAIMSMTKAHCMVIREGALESIDSGELVYGHLVFDNTFFELVR